MERDDHNEITREFLEIMHEFVYAMTIKDRTAVIDGSIVDCEELDANEMASEMNDIRDATPKTTHQGSIGEFMSRDMDISKEMDLLNKALNGDRSEEIWKEMGDE